MRRFGSGVNSMRDLYLIDGYNVIFGAPSEFSKNDLESSRKKLIDMLQDYGAHQKQL